MLTKNSIARKCGTTKKLGKYCVASCTYYVQDSSILSSLRQMMLSPLSLPENTSFLLVFLLLPTCTFSRLLSASLLPFRLLDSVIFSTALSTCQNPNLSLPLCKPYGLADKAGSMLIQELKANPLNPILPFQQERNQTLLSCLSYPKPKEGGSTNLAPWCLTWILLLCSSAGTILGAFCAPHWMHFGLTNFHGSEGTMIHQPLLQCRVGKTHKGWPQEAAGPGRLRGLHTLSLTALSWQARQLILEVSITPCPLRMDEVR